MKHCLILVIALAACGGKKSSDQAGGAAAGGGLPCGQVAAKYVELMAGGGGNRIAGLKPSPEETQVLVARLEADCTTRPWPAAAKTCLVGMKMVLAEESKCWPRGGMSAQVGQLIFDVTKELEAKRAPTP